MRQKALLITGGHPCGMESRAARLLEFFGIGYDRQTGIDFTLPEDAEAEQRYRLIAAAQSFDSVSRALQRYVGLEHRIHSVFLFSNGDPVTLARIVSDLSGSNISVRRGAKDHPDWTISDDPDLLHATMRGLRVHPASNVVSNADFFETDDKHLDPLIASGDKIAFLKLNWRRVPVFICSVPLVDIDAGLTTQNFDVRDHLFDA